jgi:hypothetical protein
MTEETKELETVEITHSDQLHQKWVRLNDTTVRTTVTLYSNVFAYYLSEMGWDYPDNMFFTLNRKTETEGEVSTLMDKSCTFTATWDEPMSEQEWHSVCEWADYKKNTKTRSQILEESLKENS